MAAFNRFMQVPASRRTYSYFSSRSGGGGRYFTSAKPPKTAVVASKGAVSSKVEPSAEGTQDNVRSTSTQSNGVSAANAVTESSPSSPAQGTSSQTTGIGSDGSTNATTTSDQANNLEPSHSPIPLQIVNSKDFKMHQFFSLHRPLLLISQPSSLFRNVPANNSFLNPPPLSEAEIYRRVMQSLSGLGDPNSPVGLEAPISDADAEAARQLTRAFTMSKASATVSWEQTLQTLGLDVSQEADRVNLQKQFEKDWEEVMMDSTKRKRRKKMKKHKLKKRRRATRSERLKLKA